jgi:hypothetical protein
MIQSGNIYYFGTLNYLKTIIFFNNMKTIVQILFIFLLSAATLVINGQQTGSFPFQNPSLSTERELMIWYRG